MISLREVSERSGGFAVDVEIDGARFCNVTLDLPFGEDARAREDLLEWYFETWLQFPMLDTARATKAAQVVREYGEALFEQIFADRRAHAAYEAWRQRPVERRRIAIIGSPAFHRLHWEALRDKDRDRELATEVPLVRSAPVTGVDRAEPVQEAPVIRVLVVTARPGGPLDVGYRTISRPLLDALRNIETPVAVELLRPGTFRAFCDHLEAHTATPYHVVHFDLHGALMSFEEAR